MKENLKAETVENPVLENGGENNVSKKEELLNKGEERYEKTAQFISGAGERVKGWIKGGATKLGRFFKGAAVRAFAAPDAVAHGTTVAVNKIGEEVQLAKEGAQFVGGKIVEGAKSVGDDFVKFDKYTSEKAEQAGEWIGGKAASVYETTKEKADAAKKLINTKKEQIADIASDSYDLARVVGVLAKEATLEGLTAAGNKISENYEKITNFGKGVVDSATLEVKKAKNKLFSKINDIKKDMVKSILKGLAEYQNVKLENNLNKTEKQKEKLQKTLKKLEQFETVGNLEASLAA